MKIFAVANLKNKNGVSKPIEIPLLYYI